MHTAVFRCITDDARALYLSVCQEMGDVGDRSSAHLRLVGDDTLVLEVTATDIPALRAALNTWLRLITIAFEMREIAAPSDASR
ncbi:KEOPS complex subunit Pcc1 [Methanoculleus sp.]|jgi:KEOPS complex subunit Pcc1|uniref:KEOPS complex subunit Pcc1 n=1 Tax=Methanoculleus sp. TaxID=90427 RepID=UPI001BD33E3E|nr:KEOPS complex subunit Pcc1 [Methanoculleus sp.]